jgi:hypothetical protein
MSRLAASVPDASSLLCEQCGYVLDGLPVDSRCPECGSFIRDSLPEHRHLSAWESAGRPIEKLAAFFTTTGLVLLRPAHFFRHLSARASSTSARSFAFIHWLLAAAIIGRAASIHGEWLLDYRDYGVLRGGLLTAGALLLMWVTTRLAARLTHWEASYRGLRLPMPVVLRALYFHSAHYLPVALVVLGTVVGFHYTFDHFPFDITGLYWFLKMYHYVLCGEVVVGAVYLFQTYWIGMRNMMYANG